MDRQLDYLIEVSIHAPRVGSDGDLRPRLLRVSVFQSTLPAWGATVRAHLLDERQHYFQSTLPAWGATRTAIRLRTGYESFNPRSPRGERPFHRTDHNVLFVFQSTLPAWGATPGPSLFVMP